MYLRSSVYATMLSQTRSALFTFSSFHFHYTTVKIKNNWRIFSGIFGSAALNYNSIYPSKNGFRMRAICYTLSRGTAAAILPLSMYWSWTMSIVDYPASVLSCTTIIRIKINQICLNTHVSKITGIFQKSICSFTVFAVW